LKISQKSRGDGTGPLPPTGDRRPGCVSNAAVLDPPAITTSGRRFFENSKKCHFGPTLEFCGGQTPRTIPFPSIPLESPDRPLSNKILKSKIRRAVFEKLGVEIWYQNFGTHVQKIPGGYPSPGSPKFFGAFVGLDPLR
jgi:hypothetical protein